MYIRNTDDYGFTMPPMPDYSRTTDGSTELDDFVNSLDRPRGGKNRIDDTDIGTTDLNNPDSVSTVVIDEGPHGSDGKPVQVVVGWLVGIQGLSQGLDFRLHSGQNRIGRRSDMDVSLQDERISRTASIDIYYDPMGNQFYASNGGGKCLSYINRKLLMGTQELHPYDRIQLGIDKRGTVEIISEMLFVPLCGEQFSWAEINQAENKDEK